MSVRLEDLTPPTAAAATRALADLKARGVPVAVTYTLRTYAEQRALYAQGREDILTVNSLRHDAGLPPIGQADNDYTVTKCDGLPLAQGGKGRSPHQLGTAIDVVPLGKNGPEWPHVGDGRWADIAKSFEAEGFEWGGRWTDFIDLPHYQLVNV